MIENNIHTDTWRSILENLKGSQVNIGEIFERLSEQPYRATDTGIHPKIMADWKRNGLLMSEHTANKMHRFSIAEFVWIKLIEKMRAFNFPLKAIQSFRDDMMGGTTTEIEELWNTEFLFNFILHMENGKNPEKIRAYLARPETKDEAMGLLPPGMKSGNRLETLVLFSLTLKTPVSFLVDHSGKGTLFNPLMLMGGVYDDDETERVFTSSYVSLSLTEVLAEVLSLSDMEILHGQLMIVSDMEANVIQALREDELTSVLIRYDQNHQMDLMEIKKLQKAERETRLLEMILKKGYQDITVKTQHGKVIYCENTRKVKLK
ncbi:MAG TPA: hypothetical protein DCR04_01860 [Flavobacteriales bacterium]|nr:hypothetical protein [Flavobacteriales bacterium]